MINQQHNNTLRKCSTTNWRLEVWLKITLIKCSTTLLQAITGEHKCRKVTATFSLLTCYCLKKGRATFYRPETIVSGLLLLMVLYFKVITSKHQFVVLHFRIVLVSLCYYVSYLQIYYIFLLLRKTIYTILVTNIMILA